MPLLVPAILEHTKEAFETKASQIIKIPGVERIQVDFGDGKFVPNSILPVSEIDMLNPAFIWEAHLMTEESQDFLDYQIAGFKTVILHYEAFKNVESLRQALVVIKQSNIEPGLCIKAETPVSVLADFADEVKHFQLMAIHPGFQGTPFLEETYERITELRKLLPNAIIEIDGGINETNIKKVASAGADLLVVGLALFKENHPSLTFEKLSSEISKLE